MAPNLSGMTSSVSAMFSNATSRLSSSRSNKSLAHHNDDPEEAQERGPAFRNASGGIGNDQGGEADLEVPVRDIIIHSTILFFTFLGIACFGAVAGFQAKWFGVSGLSGFALFLSIFTFCISAVLICVPLIYDKWDKLRSFALALKIPRVRWILEGTGIVSMLILAFVCTISAFTQKGCKNAANDPHAELGDKFKEGLPGWCRTKKAGSMFFWLGFLGWLALVVFTFLAWRSTRKSGPRDEPFAPPATEDDFDSSYNPKAEQSNASYSRPTEQQDEESPFADQPSYAAGRPSTDAYGAFGGAVPEGYGDGGAGGVSRTMQMAQGGYAGGRTSAPPQDPFSEIRTALISPPPQHAQLPPTQPYPQQYAQHPPPQPTPSPYGYQPQPYTQPTPPPQQPYPYGHPPPQHQQQGYADPYARHQQQPPQPMPTPPGYDQMVGGYR